MTGFESILFVGPSSKRYGGIATVLKLYKQNFNAFYFSSTHFQSTFLSFLFFPERILSFALVMIFNQNIKIVHIHSSSQGSFYRNIFNYLIARVFRKKVILHIHSGRFIRFYEASNPLIKKTIKHIINNADVLIVLSQSWINDFKDKFNPKRVEVISNIIPNPKIYKERVKEAQQQKIKVIYLGKIFQPKGIYDLLDCIVENYETLKHLASFTIAGSGEKKLTQKYRDLDKNNIINFTGWIGAEEKHRALSKSDILILPSYSEGLPISILEAMSYKMPILASAVGGIPDIVEHDKNGLLFAPGDKKAMLNSLLHYINNKDIIIKHGKASYAKVKSHFPKNVKVQLIKLYNSI